ncbi:hypothetical protein WN943_021452 [Citrus x changshan-huyou]
MGNSSLKKSLNNCSSCGDHGRSIGWLCSERWIFLCNFSSRVVCVIRKKLIWTLLGAIKKIFKSIDRSRLTGEVKVNEETEDTVLGLELEAAIIACRSSSDTKLKCLRAKKAQLELFQAFFPSEDSSSHRHKTLIDLFSISRPHRLR